MPSPSLSPRLQSMSAPAPTADQAKTLFEQGLSQMAYNVLLSKLPNVAPDVVTFKILDSDPEVGNGVGSFVVAREGLTFYIPVVMAENQIKPLDLLYHKDLNVFLPLTKEWLEQLGKNAVGELGQGVKPPNTLSTDVDIRNTVVPPTTGRYSYASEQEQLEGGLLGKHSPGFRQLNQTMMSGGLLGQHSPAIKSKSLQISKSLGYEPPEKHAAAPFEAAVAAGAEPKLAFLDFLGKAPNRVKKAAAHLFETKPKLLKLAARFYGQTALIGALTPQQEKVADYGKRLSPGGALYIADKSTSTGEFKDIFGAEAGIAYQGVLRKGYHAKDSRKQLSEPVAVQPFMDYQEPKNAGAYRLWKSDGSPVLAFILANPTDLTSNSSNRVSSRNIRFRVEAEAPALPSQGNGVKYRMPGADGTDGHVFADRYVGVTEDGKLINVTKLIGSAVEMGELSGSPVYKKTVGEAAAAGPRAGQTGFFVMRKGDTFVGTRAVRIESVSTDSAGTKLIKIFGSHGLRTLAIHPDRANGILLVPPEGIIHVPSNYSWIPTSGELTESDLMTNPKDAVRWAMHSITKTAAERVIVKKAYHGFTFGENPKQGFEFVPALRKLATEANISVDDAEFVLKQAEEKGRFEFYAVKSAAEGAPPKEKQPPADPAQMAMDQVQQAQMAQAPQGPSPIDMAVAEQMQNLQAQMQALTQMQQLMQTVQQRANQIAGGGGAMGDPAAAAAAMGGPMDPSMQGAGAPVPGMGGDPMQGQGQPMPQDPMAGGMGAPPPQGQPGMDPSMQQGQPMPQDPMAGGMPPQGQPGMDPSMQQGQPQQPPQAMMAADDGDINSLVQQVNPQFMEQAGQLNDAGVFDSAALASMAQSPVLRDLVQAYLPNLEKSLDNIGRVLLTLWMDESHVKEDIGAETFVGLEDNLRTVFKGMGDLILKVNQNALVLRDKNESVFQG